MRVIKPVQVNDTNLISSTIAEPDTGRGEVAWSAGTFNTGDRVIKVSTHKLYECVADPSTTDDPEVGVLKTVPTWVIVSPTNKFAMFDTVISTQSFGDDELIFEFQSSSITNSIAGFNINNATSINVTVTDADEGVVYNQDISMIDNQNVTDWYFYYFSPIINVKRFFKLDLPAYRNGVIKITVDGTDVSVGDFIFGGQIILGQANYGSSVQLLDFSQVSEDDFGNIKVTDGRKARLVNFDLTIERSKVNYVFNTLTELTTIPSAWIGDDQTDDPTLVFGYYRNFQNNISTPTLTDATLEIRGIV
jgi:hypothetical protein